MCHNCASSTDNKGEGNSLRQMTIHKDDGIDNGQEPYECKYCDCLFITEANLRDHTRIHSNEKHFTCSHCKKCFDHEKCLSNHLIKHVTFVFASSPFEYYWFNKGMI